MENRDMDLESSSCFASISEGLLKEVMQDVIAYVEVCIGEEDHSESVSTFMETLGVRVNRTFENDTTHVVFKEGRLSTFQKAQQLGIPVVSILWLEACIAHKTIFEPTEYPITDLYRYQNPDQYELPEYLEMKEPDIS